MAQERLIICNTSPLINLAEIGRLDLLEKVLSGICIPPAVRDELKAKSSLFPRAAAAADSGQFRILSPADALLVRSFSSTLHRGEAECLALGMENPGSLLILDDLSARAVASANGLLFTGTLGVLSAAKARGHVDALAPVLHDLRIRARFWISLQLERLILEEAGEVARD
jgi:predicted nucleic acid-binding protein